MTSNPLSRTLIATDLDRTLIYSQSAVNQFASSAPLTCVELYQNRPASFMTSTAALDFSTLASQNPVVAVTTRTREQFQRIQLPGPPATYAVTTNGGVLLVDGGPDPSWSAHVSVALAESAPLTAIRHYLDQVCRSEWTTALRNADDLFCYAVIDRSALPDDFADETSAWAAARGWRVSLQGRKLYCVPTGLSKSAAVAELARRLEPDRILAAGDSLLDAELLQDADRGIHPRHGELFDRGWSAPGVESTEAAGIAAGAEIIGWFARNRS